MLSAVRILGAAFVLLAAAPLAAQTPPAALLTQDAVDAAVWRAAGRRLQTELNELAPESRGRALSSDIAAWRHAPASARAEAALAMQVAQRWFAAIQASLAGARWPAGQHPAEAYARLAPTELLAAWRELEQAAASGESPQAALARAWRVRDWTQGHTDRATPFDTLEAEALGALAEAAAPGTDMGPPVGAEPLTRETAVAGLMFAGAGGDRVGPRAAQPDGVPDIRLMLMTVHRGRTPIRIELVPIDAGHHPCCDRRWSSGDPGAEFLGVISGSLGNGQGYAASLQGFGDQIELVVNDGPAFRIGARLAAIIFYADGSRDHGLIEMPASRGP